MRIRLAPLTAALFALVAALPVAPAAAQLVPDPPVSPDLRYEVLSLDTQDPLAIQVAPDGRVIWTEREGALKVLLPDGTQITAGRVPVSANACNDCVEPQEEQVLEEGGLHGLLLAQDFEQSGRIYLFYSKPFSKDPVTGFGVMQLSTFVLSDDNVLDLASEEPILEVPAEWEHCCHYAGNLEWLPDGTILLTTGDDVPATSSGGYGARDARAPWTNAELSSANPADRRGKVLRLMPDGSVPDGTVHGVAANPFLGQSARNPYIPDTSGDPTDGLIAYDPYVYAVGYKNPFRGAVNPETGHFYVGDVGPDAVADDSARGSRGFEEINVVPPGGGVNHGWPRCIADNRPYHDVDWTTDPATDHGPLDCSEMTGAVIWYPRAPTPDWPILGAGLVTSVPGVVYPEDASGALALPQRFGGDLILAEFSRSSIFSLPIAADGSLVTDWTRWETVVPGSRPNTFVPGQRPPAGPYTFGSSLGLTSPIDVTVGPDGALYVLEYGEAFYNGATGKVGRITGLGIPDPADYGLPAGSDVDYGVDELAPAEAAAASASGLGAGVSAAALGIGALTLVAVRRRRGVV